MTIYRKWQLVTVTKKGDIFYGRVGRVLELENKTLTLDFRYTKKIYNYSDVEKIGDLK